MSERSFRRDHQRRIANAERRESLRARKAAAAAVAVGAFALGAPAASSAANFVVNDSGTNSGVCVPNSTPAGCTLPDAVDQANANSEDDTITFDSSLSGSTIDLTTGTNTGPLVVNSPGYSLTITGLGANNLTVDAAGDSNVIEVQNPYGLFSSSGPKTFLSVSGLKITGGSGTYAGGIYTDFNTNFTLTDSVVTGNSASGDIDSVGPYALFAASGGGLTNKGTASISNTLFYENYSNGSDPYMGGGAIDNAGRLSLTDSLITGNAAVSAGGGLFNGGSKYPQKLDVQNTTISNNYSENGGGGVGAFDIRGSKYGASDNRITNSTISGNYSNEDGGGVALKYTAGKDRWTISHSTISGPNQAAYSDGGGIALEAVAGTFTLIDSTVSGNTAYDTGGGVYVSEGAQKYPGAVQIQNSTVASNQTLSPDSGGGIYLDGFYGSYTGNKYPVHTTIGSTIVADNTVDGQPEDLDQGTNGEPGTGFDLSFDLIGTATDNAVINELPPGSNIFGADPQLGPLADNGGPTFTMLPATTSPVIDKGNAPSGLTTDQRGDPRTADTTPANASDGTDIGAVELPSGTGPPSSGGNLGSKVHNVKKKHKKRSHVIRTFHSSAKVHLTFSSPIAGATFTCSVDGGAFAPCTSPFSARLKSAPGHGAPHSITIVTKDQAGNQLGQPKIFKFRIIQKT